MRSMLTALLIIAPTSVVYADCKPMFSFTAGRSGSGVVQNVSPGFPCRIPLYRSVGASNAAELQSVQVVKQPTQGSTSVEGTSVIFNPKPSFSGNDEMTIRYSYVNRAGRPIKSDIRFRIR